MIPQPGSSITHALFFMLISLLLISGISISSKRKEKRSIGYMVLPLMAHMLFHISNIYEITYTFSIILVFDQVIGFLFQAMVLKHSIIMLGKTKLPKVFEVTMLLGIILSVVIYVDVLLNRDIHDYIYRIAEGNNPPFTYLIGIALVQVNAVILSYFMYKNYKSYIKGVFNFTSNKKDSMARYLKVYYTFLMCVLGGCILFILLFPSELAHYLLIPVCFYLFFMSMAILLNQVPESTLVAHDELINNTGERLKLLPAEENKKGDIEERINKSFSSNKIFLNPNLTINRAALELGISAQELSNYINSKLNLNFFEFVNYYRIQESKTLLRDKASKHLSMEGIGKKSGFNSRASFYRAFKKHENTTPGEYFSS